MSQYQQNDLPPAPPDHLPETPQFPRRSRYQRPRSPISWFGVFLGLVLGVGGALFYAWEYAPRIEYDTHPRQLRAEDKTHYAVAVMLNYAHNGDLSFAIERLISLDLGSDPIQAVADHACELARSNYISFGSGLRAVQSMKTFYQLQGRTGCADTLVADVADAPPLVEIAVPTVTPSLPPPPTKTPTPSGIRATPTSILVAPTRRPQSTYTGRIQNTFCDTELSGIIEVYVLDINGEGLPGERVRVRWDNGSDIFVTGLKPERGNNYADFQMEPAKGYTVDMPGRSDPIPSPLVADTCIADGGAEALTSYRVVFRQTG